MGTAGHADANGMDMQPETFSSVPRSKADQGNPPPRRFGRLRQDRLMCNLGQVIDISAGGMLVRGRRIPSGFHSISLAGHKMPGELVACVAWSRRVGLFAHESGMSFANLTPELSRVLSAIATANRFRNNACFGLPGTA
jgi:hypothetical protein